MGELFSKFVTGLGSPGMHAEIVAPNDSVDLDTFARALLIGVAGDIKLTTAGGETVTLTVPVGVLPLRCRRIFATDTTAENITAIW